MSLKRFSVLIYWNKQRKIFLLFLLGTKNRLMNINGVTQFIPPSMRSLWYD